MAAASNWLMYDQAKEFIGDGTIDLDAGDGFFAVPLLLVGYTPNLGTHTTYADISASEHANGNGYTTGGVAEAVGITWVEVAGTVTLDMTDPVWTASGGSIVARYAALVYIAAGTGVPQSTDKLIAYCLLDTAPADVTATTGNTLTIQIHTSGVFNVSGGDT